MRQLVADFRREYHVSYHDVPTGEAVQLASMLREGSDYLAALDPHLAWTRQEHELADIYDAVERFLMMKSSAGTTEGARRMPRPGQAEDARAERERARDVRARIDDTEWEAVDG